MYICRVCEKDFDYPMYFDESGKNQYVCGHHIETQGANPAMREDPMNGVCVCSPCHLKLHNGEKKL